LKKTLIINTHKEPITVNLSGKVDRIDRVVNMLRIIDYKTGLVKDEDVKLDSWDDLYNEKLSDKLVQLLLYTYMYAHQYQISDFKCGFYSLKKNTDGFMFIQFPEGQENYNAEINDAIESFLSDTLTNMFNEDIPLEQTTIKENCQFCDFKIICNRL